MLDREWCNSFRSASVALDQIQVRARAGFAYLRQELDEGGESELIREVRERADFFRALEYRLLDSDGRVLVAGDLPDLATEPGWTDLEIDAGHYRVRTADLPGGMRLLVGDDMAPTLQLQQAFLGALGWILLVFIALSLLGGFLLSRAFLSRVDAITDTAEAIIAGDFRSRVRDHGTQDNFDRLSRTLNRMLDRIQVLMESLSQVSNDIAHALRTPLGRLRQKLESAKALTEPESPAEQAIASAVAETDNILETFSALLRIAQMEAASRSAGFKEIDLSALFANVADAYAPVAEE